MMKAKQLQIWWKFSMTFIHYNWASKIVYLTGQDTFEGRQQIELNKARTLTESDVKIGLVVSNDGGKKEAPLIRGGGTHFF